MMDDQETDIHQLLAELDPNDWKQIEPLLQNHSMAVLEYLSEETPGIIISDDTSVAGTSTGRRKSALAHFIVPLLNEISLINNNCSIAKAAELALEEPWVKLRGTSTAAGVRSAYNNQLKKPAKLTLNMFYWFLQVRAFREAAMAFRNLSGSDQKKFVKTLQVFSNRTRSET